MRLAALISLAVLLNFGLAQAAEKAVPEKGGPPPPRASAAAPRPQEIAPTTAPAANDIAPDEDKADEKGKMEPKEDSAARGSALPIPRFVSLRTDPINLRTGPGVRYPVEWVYVRRRLPVEVIAEFDTWRQIRDPDGAEGWVHQTMLSGRRTAVIAAASATLHSEGNDTAPELAHVEKGVIVTVQRCAANSDYCRVEAGGIQGWLRRDQVWGVYPNEPIPTP